MSDSDSMLKRGLKSSRVRNFINPAVSKSRFLVWASHAERLSSSIYTATIPIRAGLSQIITHSFVYRWMTEDPDPEVIVIDLRDTLTVGPVIGVFMKMVSVGTSALRSSQSTGVVDRLQREPLRLAGVAIAIVGVIQAAEMVVIGSATPVGLILWCAVIVAGLVAITDTRSWSELGGSKTGEFLMIVFEPPEPADAPDSAETDRLAEQPNRQNDDRASDGKASHDQESE